MFRPLKFFDNNIRKKRVSVQGGDNGFSDDFHPIAIYTAGVQPAWPRIRVWGGNKFEGNVTHREVTQYQEVTHMTTMAATFKKENNSINS